MDDPQRSPGGTGSTRRSSGEAPDEAAAAEYLVRELLADEDDDHLPYDRLAAYVDRTVSTTERQVIEDHVAICRSCADDVAGLSATAGQISARSARREHSVHAGALPRWLASVVESVDIRAERQSTWWRPGFAWGLAAAAIALPMVLLYSVLSRDAVPPVDSAASAVTSPPARPPVRDSGAEAALREAQGRLKQAQSEAATGPTVVVRTSQVAPDDVVWRQLARGDRAAVLARVEAADRGRAAADLALAQAVLDTVRATVLRTRQAAVAAGGGGDTYRAGDEELARANRLAAEGQRVQSLRAFWQAADLFEGSPPGPAEPGVALTEPERPAATRPSSADAASVSAAILVTLRRYEMAYESRDVDALLQVFASPSQEQVAQVRRELAGVTTYEMNIQNVRLDIGNDFATVHARVTKRVVLSLGTLTNTDVDTEFRLQRMGEEWLIAGVESR